jgi:hypothetical protein
MTANMLPMNYGHQCVPQLWHRGQDPEMEESLSHWIDYVLKRRVNLYPSYLTLLTLGTLPYLDSVEDVNEAEVAPSHSSLSTSTFQP